MVTHQEYPWPKPPQAVAAPRWTGRGFDIDGRVEPVLSFNPGGSNWTEDLTSLHESEAGEGDHFIDVFSRRDAVAQLRRWVIRPNPTFLEVGCSSGYLLRDLRGAMPTATILGSDFIRRPLERLAEQLPDLPLLQFDVVRCPLPDASLDGVVMLNVLEHIEDDRGAMRQVFRVLRPGGVVVIEVPAGPHLYDAYDKVLMHHRRYTLAGVSELVTGAGFTVLRASHLGAAMYPAFRWVKKRNQRFLDASPEEQRRRFIANVRGSHGGVLPRAVMRLEQWVGRWVSYPRGIRCIISARRP